MGKKVIVKHHLNKFGTHTECGRYITKYTPSTIRTNITWKGVTCKKCLQIKANADARKAAKKANKKVKV